MSTIAFVPLRGGSKSIPQKNIKTIAGRPLAYWLLASLENSKSVSEIVVATDCAKIKAVLSSMSFKKLSFYNRLPENALDKSSTESVLLEYLNTRKLNPSTRIILAQATSPLTSSSDIDDALESLEKSASDSLLSVCKFKRFLWSYEGKSLNYNYLHRPRRQDFDGTLIENGAFYISTVKLILESKNRISGRIVPYVMPDYTMHELDEAADWIVVESLLRHYRQDDTPTFANRVKIKLFLTDVDGVLTDAGMYYSENGEELKKFNTYDGVAIKSVKSLGIPVGFVTSENSKTVSNRAKKLNVDYCLMGVEDKLKSVLEICKKTNIGLENVSYIGDDVNCLELLSAVGFKACPSNAVDRVKRVPGIVQLCSAGGTGALREWVSVLLGQDNET